jgi:RND family efflux transporter MFP subunit
MEKTSFWKQLLVSGALIAAAGAAWQYRSELIALWNGPSQAVRAESVQRAASRGTPVIVAPVRMVQDDLTFSVIGTGFALRSVTLRAPSGGEITSLAISPGQRFAAGDVVMRLDDTDERLAVALAEAQLERATSERDRYRALQTSGTAAEARFEDAQTAFRVAQIELEKAQLELADKSLIAPFDGVTGIASVEAGDRIVTDQPISSFDDRSSILVEFDLPEALLGRVSPGVEVKASTPAVEGQSFDGRISAIDSRVDAQTRTARVRAEIDNSSDLLRPGASFSIVMDLAGDKLPAVPELALQFDRGALFVWRVVDGEVEKVEVRLVRRSAGEVIVEGPLSEFDPVVIEGTQRLRPGAAADVLNSVAETSS